MFQCRQLKRLCSRWQSPPKKLPTQVKVILVSLSLEQLFLKSQEDGNVYKVIFMDAFYSRCWNYFKNSLVAFFSLRADYLNSDCKHKYDKLHVRISVIQIKSHLAISDACFYVSLKLLRKLADRHKRPSKKLRTRLQTPSRSLDGEWMANELWKKKVDSGWCTKANGSPLRLQCSKTLASGG